MTKFSNAHGTLECHANGGMTFAIHLPTGDLVISRKELPSHFDPQQPWVSSPAEFASSILDDRYKAESHIEYAIALRQYAVNAGMDGVDRDRICRIIDVSLVSGHGDDEFKISVLRHDIKAHGFDDFLQRGPKVPVQLNRQGQYAAKVLSSLFEEARTLHRQAEQDLDVALC